MIVVALKHFIYEICIENLFNSIFQNFSTQNTPKFNSQVSVGDRFASIVVRRDTIGYIKKTIYYNPIVVATHDIYFEINIDGFTNVHYNGTTDAGVGYHDNVPVYYCDVISYYD